MVDKKAYQKKWRDGRLEKERDRRKRWDLANPELMKIGKKKWELANTEYMKEWRRKYREEHKAREKETHQIWRENNKEKIKEGTKMWHRNNPEKTKTKQKKYRQTGKGIEANRKVHSRRRSFDFVPLNKYFKGSEAHHVDRQRVIYIPKPLHRSVWHSVVLNVNMEKINRIAFDFMESQGRLL